jgi:hypothetical protein
VMKPEMQEKIKAKIKKSWKYDCRESVVNLELDLRSHQRAGLDQLDL